MSISNTNKPRILLLSGYDAASHRHWRNVITDGLTQFEWTEIALPDRYFSWRIRGNGLTFAYQHKDILDQEYDCLIATSMVDLATLRGFAPQLANIPNILYFHENQFEYPIAANSQDSKNVINAQLTSIYALLCADQVLFNSQFNRQTFFRGANKLLKKLPDGIPKNLLTEIETQVQVLPVPISPNSYLRQSNLVKPLQSGKINQPVEIVWNHRWEYDKQPEVFFDALKLLKQDGFKFKIHLLGQAFRQKPECFDLAKSYFSDEILTWGYQSKRDYQQILATADIVISTAAHDFQGLSMLEAIAGGCTPIAPDRVVYPEYIDEANLYPVEGEINEANSLFEKIIDVHKSLQNLSLSGKLPELHQHKIKEYLDQHLLIKYAQIISSTIQRCKKTSC